jgi:hypothetical protein
VASTAYPRTAPTSREAAEAALGASSSNEILLSRNRPYTGFTIQVRRTAGDELLFPSRFPSEHGFLSGRTPAVPANGTRFPDNPMAWNNKRDRVLAHGTPDRSRGLRLLEMSGNILVTDN